MSGQCFLHATHGEHCDVSSSGGAAPRAGSVWIFSTRPTGHRKLHHVLPANVKLTIAAITATAPRKPASHTALPLVAHSRRLSATTMSASWTTR